MASKLGWIIVIVLLSNKISFASSSIVTVGSFQNTRRHPRLKSCAQEVLREDMYVGGRVHMLTGECEGLDHSWGLNQTVQSGYAYTKKILVQKSLSPPVRNDHISIAIPIVLREGAVVAVECGIPQDSTFPRITFADSLDDGKEDVKAITMRIIMRWSTVYYQVEVMNSILDKECKLPSQRRKERSKISFRFHTGSLEVLFDDVEICMFDTRVDPSTLRKIRIYAGVKVTIHDVQFIDA